MSTHIKSLLCTAAFLALILPSAGVHAQDGTLKIDADLIIHPNQMANFFTLAGQQINTTANWSWASLAFTQPYKTQWTQVQAQGPFTVQFDTSNLANHEIGFTLNWPNPVLTAGTFTINDTVQRVIDGINFIFHLNGTCSNVSLSIPNGNWVVTGKMQYSLNWQNIVVTANSFQLQSNAAAVPQVNLGKCQGDPGTLQQVQQAMVTVSGNQGWLQNVMQQGLVNWAQNSMNTVYTQLLSPRTSMLTSDMSLLWQPAALTELNGGLLWVTGTVTIDKKGAPLSSSDTAPRNYTTKTLSAVTQSAFLMANTSLQHVLNYMFTNGELLYRVNSSTIPAFTSLMDSRFDQFFVWPDLMSFSKSTAFYFDLTTANSPQLGKGWILDGGGSAYDFAMPMVVHQWAPSNGQYLPYVDFFTPVTGRLNASINNGQLTLQMNAGGVSLSDAFRPEFAAIRSENTWINTDLLGSNVLNYINSTPFTSNIPSWTLDPAISLQMTDIQVWTETLRLPLDFLPPSN